MKKGSWGKDNLVSLTVAICIGAAVFVVLWHLPAVLNGIGTFIGFFRSVIFGLIFAYILNPLVRLFENRILKNHLGKRTRHAASIALTIILVIVLAILLALFLIPQIISSVKLFLSNLDIYIESTQKALGSVQEYFADMGMDLSGLIANIDEMFKGLQNALPNGLNGIFSTLQSIGTNVMDFFIAAIIAVYFLADKERLLHGSSKILRSMQKPETNRKTMAFLKQGNEILIRYIVFDLLDALFVGVANGIFMMIARLPYGVMVSVVVAITNLAPTFGPIIGCVIGCFLLFLVNPVYALEFLIFTIILQFFDGYVLKPKMFSGALGVPSVLIICCIVVGGKMFGIWGILLAIPFATMFYYVLRETVLKKLDKRDAEQALADAGGPAATEEE